MSWKITIEPDNHKDVRVKSVPCPVCRGKGYDPNSYMRKLCPKCGGMGTVRVREKSI